MQVLVNGEALTLPEGTTLDGLLKQLELTGGRLAVEVNREIIPRSEHPQHQLSDGDRVEVVHAIGGG